MDSPRTAGRPAPPAAPADMVAPPADLVAPPAECEATAGGEWTCAFPRQTPDEFVASMTALGFVRRAGDETPTLRFAA